MLKFNYKLIVRERVTAKCVRHPRYNPEKEGRAGPWARTREPRRCKSKDAIPAPVESPQGSAMNAR